MTLTSSFKKYLLFFTLFGLLISFAGQSEAISASFDKRDDVITAQVKAKIAEDSDLIRFNIGVTTSEGIVSLNATVGTVAEADKVVMLTNSIAGVKSVDASNLVVQKADAATFKPVSGDNVINSGVVGLFVREGLMDLSNPASSNLRVVTQSGVVYLSGTLANQAQIDKAVNFAQSINGVVKVVSTLKTP